jgi:adenosylmethionine-8-amino-7-oxononanoate aminotransferase
MPDPIAIVKGRNSLLMDADGNTYIDAISSWWVNLHGHAHPYIAEKIYAQALELEQVIFAGFTHAPAVTLAERLLSILPGNLAKVFFSDNGSTSTEVALKMAIQYWWNQGQNSRKKILAFRNAYHGDTFGAMSVSDRGVFTLAFHQHLFEVVFIDTPNADNIEDALNIISTQGQEIAAFIYEPLVQGAGGMCMYTAANMDVLLSAAKAEGIICIADEVMTGFGRTGRLFASEYLTHTPDIVCLSKGITGGFMPLGVTACAAFLYEAFVQDDQLKTFFHGHSFTANPLACAAANASLDLLLTDTCTQQRTWLEKETNQLAYRIKNIAQETQKIANIRHLGTILAFEINEGQTGYLNGVSQLVTKEALQSGLYIRPLGNTVYTMPPYCTTDAEFCRISQFLENIVNK